MDRLASFSYPESLLSLDVPPRHTYRENSYDCHRLAQEADKAREPSRDFVDELG